MLTKYLLTQNPSAKEGKKALQCCVSVTWPHRTSKKNPILWDVLVKDFFFFSPFRLYLKHFPAFLQGHLVLSFSSFPLVPSKSATVSSFSSVKQHRQDNGSAQKFA